MFPDDADYMAGDTFRADLNDLFTLPRAERAVILCSEAVPWRCHRRLVADAMLVANVQVVHIMSTTATTRCPDLGRSGITYPKPNPIA